MNILIVDDDIDIAMVTADCLEDAGFTVTTASSAKEALQKISDTHLILLDINLPGETGFDLCKKLREETKIPIIFISARTSDTDKIEGLDIGGDDYVPKPYSLGELTSRVKAHIRRNYPQKVTINSIEVDFDGRRVYKSESEVMLSAKEFDLLKYLIQNKNTVVSKEKLFSAVWGEYSEAEASSLTVHIRWLREKLEDDPSDPKLIKTVHRVGYMLEVDS